LSAAADRGHPPAAGPPARFEPPRFSRRRAEGGLEVVLAARPGPPLVEALLLLPAGGERNPLDRSGLATLTASLVDEGSRRRSGLDSIRARLISRVENSSRASTSAPGWSSPSSENTTVVFQPPWTSSGATPASATGSVPTGASQTKRVRFPGSSSIPSRRTVHP